MIITIELTPEQTEKVYNQFNDIVSSNQETPGMLLAQVIIGQKVTDLAIAKVGFISHEKALKLQKVMNPRIVGKTIKDYMLDIKPEKV